MYAKKKAFNHLVKTLFGIEDMFKEGSSIQLFIPFANYIACVAKIHITILHVSIAYSKRHHDKCK